MARLKPRPFKTKANQNEINVGLCLDRWKRRPFKQEQIRTRATSDFAATTGSRDLQN
jgi:hypothetical protein